jgi:peptide deformylase
MNGYKKPHGMSGANCAIPFNIIAYMENRDKKNEKCIVMINPRIISYFGNEIISESNCGSLTLENPIKIRRAEEILIRYFDTSGIERDRYINRESGSLTIQHEVDHNNGILITDRQ